MMMERGHEQHSFAAGFKAQDLQDDGDRLDDKHAADNREEKLLLATDRNLSVASRSSVSYTHLTLPTICSV